MEMTSDIIKSVVKDCTMKSYTVGLVNTDDVKIETVYDYDAFMKYVDSITTKKNKDKDRKNNQDVTIPEPVCIVQDHAATIVHWKDGTYTSVVCGAEDASNVYGAYCAAFQKKLLGTTSAVHKMVDRHLYDNIKAKREAEIAKHQAEQAEREKRNHDRKVREEAKRMRIQQEAVQLIMNDDTYEEAEPEEVSND